MKLNRAAGTLIFCFISHLAWSQNSYLAIKTGINLSTLNSKASSGEVAGVEVSNRSGLNIGLVYSQLLDELPLGFSIEPSYNMKGAIVDNDSSDYKFHYLSMPLLLDYYPLEWIKLSVGPEISYLAGADNQYNDSTKVSILDTYDQRLELGGTIGAAVSPTFFMDLGVRYNFSLTNIADVDPWLGRKNMRTSYLQLFILLKIAN